MSAPVQPDDAFKLALRKHHLEQLRRVEIPEPCPRLPLPQLPGKPSAYDQLKQWLEQAHTQIAKAVASQAVSTNAIDWNTQILALLESSAAYLRDTDKAAIEAQKETREADERALQLLAESQAYIKKIAALWGLDFEVICDLLKYSPEGHSYMNGPYCGVFFSKDTKKPFLGLAFKGTNMANWKEVLKDLNFKLMMSVDKILWGSPIHSRFYQTMFEEFPHIKQAPLDFIKDTIAEFLQRYEVPEGITINLHTTGHSLGGAYATLCYAELMRLYNNTSVHHLELGEDLHADLADFFSELKARKFVLRDLYTFGCPRVGRLWNNVDWAKSYKTTLDNHNGKSWRVQNNFDPVTAVPPVLPWTTWNHVDNGYQINNSSSPRSLLTEVGTCPGVSLKPWNFRYHSTAAYYQNIYNASTTGPRIDLTQELLDEARSVPPEEVEDQIEAEGVDE